MVINMEADQNERHALVLCLFIAPDITISRMAKGEKKAVLRIVALVSVLLIVLWKTTPVVKGVSDLS